MREKLTTEKTVKLKNTKLITNSRTYAIIY